VTINPFTQISASGRVMLSMMFAVTLLLGAFEGVFGRVRYSGDAINYLNIVRAIHAGDWKLALNSYWGLGYPLLISIVTPLFPSSPTGEWVAIHVLNLAILAATFFTFYWFALAAVRSSALKGVITGTISERLLLIGAFCIFLSIELSMDNVSRVGPDSLISCIVFAVAALSMNLMDNPTAGSALALGTLLGIGYIVKAIFLPLGLVVSCIALVILWKKRPRFRYLALLAAPAAALSILYIAGMSWAAGYKTYGEAGPLNYAWNVNKLEPGVMWQGIPPGYGTPVHPTKLVSLSPHIFLFDGPFPVTFGPFFNPPYYYQGYRHFFSLRRQIHQLAGNIFRFLRILRFQFVIYALVLGWLIRRPNKGSGLSGLRIAFHFWPLFLISLAGTSMYLLVMVEARYVASFLAMVLLVLLLIVIARESPVDPQPASPRLPAMLLCLLLLGCGATLIANQNDGDRDVLGHALHHELFLNNEQWKTGLYLRQTGIHPGDKVAVMADLVNASRSTWAYMDDLQIVGILGARLFETETADYDVFWHSSPEVQRQLLENFHSAGARVVVALSKPSDVQAEGWESVPGTGFWVYRFSRPTTVTQATFSLH
jgi:hypothetical protein